MTSGATSNRTWWGTTRLAIGENRRWRIGPLRMRVAHLEGEWRIHHRSEDDLFDETIRLAEPVSATDPAQADGVDGSGAGEEMLRFALTGDDDEINLTPALADRPIVSLATNPFYVLPGDEVRVYVSTPLWLRLRVGAQRELCEFPILRPSNTWVGSTTGAGEAAYSTSTSCRVRLEDLSLRPHRAVTVVHVRNRASDPLRLERITVAVPHLSLYASPGGRLWTESVVLTRESDDSSVDLRITEQPPPEADAGRAITSPRQPITGNSLQRAFDALF